MTIYRPQIFDEDITVQADGIEGHDDQEDDNFGMELESFCYFNHRNYIYRLCMLP